MQNPVIRSHVTNFRRERRRGPDGDVMTAPLPAGISGYFGPELRRFVLPNIIRGQITMPGSCSGRVYLLALENHEVNI